MQRKFLLTAAAVAYLFVPLTLYADTFEIQKRGGMTIYSRGTPLSRFKVNVIGDITFTDDHGDVAAISADGYLSIERRELLRQRKVVFEPDGAGGVRRTYFIGSRSRDIDDAARIWIKEALLETFYLTGLGAESRIRKLLAAGRPVSDILDEVGRFETNEARYYYLKALGASKLSEADRVDITVAAGDLVTSSFWLGKLLVEWAKEWEQTGDLAEAIIATTREISSSYERARTLIALVDQVPLEGAAGRRLVESLEGISSSYEQARATIRVAPALERHQAALGDLIAAVASISSSYEQKRSLTAIGALPGLSAEHYALLADLTGEISSNFGRSTTLISLV